MPCMFSMQMDTRWHGQEPKAENMSELIFEYRRQVEFPGIFTTAHLG